MPIYDDNTRVHRPHAARAHQSAGRLERCDDSRQDRGPQSRLLGEVPHRRRHGVGCRRARRAEARHVRGRGDQRQHRHRARLCRRGARLRLRAHHARDDEHGAAQGADRVRREARAHARCEGHEGCHREGRGAGRGRAGQVSVDASIRQPRESRDPREDHRPRDLGRHRGQDRHFRERGRHGRHADRRLALHQAYEGARRS